MESCIRDPYSNISNTPTFHCAREATRDLNLLNGLNDLNYLNCKYFMEVS
jgi:hypothetical protein